MRARCAVATSTGETSCDRYRRPTSAMPRSVRSAAAMTVPPGGSVERRRRLQGRGFARVESSDGSKGIAKDRVDHGDTIVGDANAGNADAGPHLVEAEFRGLCARGLGTHGRPPGLGIAWILPGRLMGHKAFAATETIVVVARVGRARSARWPRGPVNKYGILEP